ncbi:Uncharacterised protein [Candidatus Gugararchaeum adminiculabundum]|nr:Uncharacterised protein [Candidatus Gugararchaeum adminiculabundum]
MPNNGRVQKLFNRQPSAKEKRAVEDSIRESIKLALTQDGAFGNITAKTISPRLREISFITFKQKGVACGLFEVQEAFQATDPSIKVQFFVKEGQLVPAGTKIAKVTGNARAILSAERTALDYLSILSGVATSARILSKKFPGQISGLRKVHPGMLWSEKRALRIGGALTHRYNLSDGYLLKENNIRQIQKEIRGSWEDAIKEGVKRAKQDRKKKGASHFIEVEVCNLSGALAAAQAKADAILLDNLSPPKVGSLVRAIRKINRQIIIEASGGINEKNAASFLRAGADFVSTSKLTLGSAPIDVSMLSTGALSQA